MDRFMRLKAESFRIRVTDSIDKIENYEGSRNTTQKVNRESIRPKIISNDNTDFLLTFDEKRKIFRSFTVLSESTMSYGRLNYILEGSKRRKKIIAREISHTGNGYIYGGYLEEYKELTDSRGWINIKSYNEKDLRELITKVIESFK